MAHLSENWLTEGLLDAEYKRYKLLAYLQTVQDEFAAWKVYPALTDLGRHYDNLYQFRQAQEKLAAAFPKELTGLDLEHAQLTYKPLPEHAALAELVQVVDFALPALGKHVERGKDLFNQVEADLRIEALGLQPLYRQLGYVLLHTNRHIEVDVYAYRLTWTGTPTAAARTLEWRFVEQATHSLVNTFEQIKYSLLKKHTGPAPATYLIEAASEYPERETLLPVAKRKLVSVIAE